MYIYDLVCAINEKPKIQVFLCIFVKSRQDGKRSSNVEGGFKTYSLISFSTFPCLFSGQTCKTGSYQAYIRTQEGGGDLDFILRFFAVSPKTIPCQMKCFGPIAILSMLNWLCVLSLIQCINKFYNKII